MLRILFVIFAVVLTVHLVGTGDVVRAIETLVEEPSRTVDSVAERLVACPPGDAVALQPGTLPLPSRETHAQVESQTTLPTEPDSDIALPKVTDEFAGDQEEASLEYRFAEIRRRAEEFLHR